MAMFSFTMILESIDLNRVVFASTWLASNQAQTDMVTGLKHKTNNGYLKRKKKVIYKTFLKLEIMR